MEAVVAIVVILVVGWIIKRVIHFKKTYELDPEILNRQRERKRYGPEIE